MKKTVDLDTPEARRLAAHALDVMAAECNMLVKDGTPPRLVCVTLLMTACRLAMQTDAMTPDALHRIFHLALEDCIERNDE